LFHNLCRSACSGKLAPLPSASVTPPLVSQGHPHSVCGTPYKEQSKKNYIKKKSTDSFEMLGDIDRERDSDFKEINLSKTVHTSRNIQKERSFENEDVPEKNRCTNGKTSPAPLKLMSQVNQSFMAKYHTWEDLAESILGMHLEDAQGLLGRYIEDFTPEQDLLAIRKELDKLKVELPF
jgi:hypothetical protein